MPNLASALRVGGLTARNRIVLPPMATGKADENGRVTRSMVAHYAERADGGPGIVIVEHAFVSCPGRLHAHQLSVADDTCVAGLALLADAIKQAGGIALLQINHAGSRAPEVVSGQQPAGPSDVPVPGDPEKPRPLERAEIQRLPGLFADAARRAQNAGFDGVEVHGAHGYLLNEFMSPYTNRRTDDYGGSRSGRARVIEEILQAVRAALQPGSVLSYRYAVNDGLEPGAGEGLTAEDAAATAPSLARCGVDLFDCSGGLCGSRPAGRQEMGYFVADAAIVKKAVAVPVAAVGGITDPEYADSIVRDESVDLVCVGRAQLTDPGWARKALEVLGL